MNFRQGINLPHFKDFLISLQDLAKKGKPAQISNFSSIFSAISGGIRHFPPFPPRFPARPLPFPFPRPGASVSAAQRQNATKKKIFCIFLIREQRYSMEMSLQELR